MNKQGEEFLNQIRGIYTECSRIQSPEQAARTTAFSILVMLDGSGEHCGTNYRVLTEEFELVDFFHHDL